MAGTENIFLAVLVVGVFANLVLLTILLRYEKGWSVGKVMLLVIHVTELLLCVTQLITLSVIITTAPQLPDSFGPLAGVFVPGWTTFECIWSNTVIRYAFLLKPVSLALLAHLRWRVVHASSKVESYVKPNIRRYIVGLLLANVVNTVASFLVALDTDIVWIPANICFQSSLWFSAVFMGSFYLALPYITFCYYKVIQFLRAQADDAGGRKAEAVRLLLILTAYYYASHIAFFVEFTRFVFLGENLPPVESQAFVILLFSHSTMSPLLSIIFTRRYRGYAARILGITSVKQTLGRTASSFGGGRSKDGSWSDPHKTAASSVERSMTYSEKAAAAAIKRDDCRQGGFSSGFSSGGFSSASHLDSSRSYRTQINSQFSQPSSPQESPRRSTRKAASTNGTNHGPSFTLHTVPAPLDGMSHTVPSSVPSSVQLQPIRSPSPRSVRRAYNTQLPAWSRSPSGRTVPLPKRPSSPPTKRQPPMPHSYTTPRWLNGPNGGGNNSSSEGATYKKPSSFRGHISIGGSGSGGADILNADHRIYSSSDGSSSSRGGSSSSRGGSTGGTPPGTSLTETETDDTGFVRSTSEVSLKLHRVNPNNAAFVKASSFASNRASKYI